MLKNLKIGKKLIVCFILVTIISSISGIATLFLMSDADAKYSHAITNYGFAQGDIGMLISTLRDNHANIMESVATDDEALTQKAVSVVDANKELLTKYSTAIQATVENDEEKSYFDEVVKAMPQFSESTDKVLALSAQNKNDEAVQLFVDETEIYLTTALNAAQKLMDYYKATGTELSDQLSAANRSTIIIMAIITVIAIIISITIASVISKAISRPMSACSDRLVLLSKGDLNSPVPKVDSKDETGILANATSELVANLKMVITDMTLVLGEMAAGNLNVTHDSEYDRDFAPLHTSTVQIIKSLNNALSQINRSADEVSGGSDQVSDGAQALSQGATEQASSVQELAATINDISAQVKDNAGSANNASDLVGSVGSKLLESNQQMQEMITAMHDISNSSNEIGKIIKTIEDIAFQTNILALNAAVEAARAGSAGKGFAVVADEVRNLATKSQEASKNTAALIENSLSAVENGSKIADETAKSLMTVVEGTKEITAGIDRIAAASSQQSESLLQVTQGVDQISSVVQTNSATAEESAAASQELSGQAQLLKGLVNQFTLQNSDY